MHSLAGATDLTDLGRAYGWHDQEAEVQSRCSRLKVVLPWPSTVTLPDRER